MRKRAITGFGVALLFVLAFVIFCQRVFTTVIVSGHSMDPTLHNGERLWACNAYWLVGPIKRKDIVVIKEEGGEGYIIKRVYAMGGDSVDLYYAPKNWDLSKGPFIVPPGQLYVLGDNREQSEDSRVFGPVDASRVLGKVVVRP